MRCVFIADEPVIRSVDPSIKFVVEHQFKGPFGCREVERVAADYREVRIYKDAAVETGIGPSRLSGSTSILIPRGGRPLVMASAIPASCSSAAADMVALLRTLSWV